MDQKGNGKQGSQPIPCATTLCSSSSNARRIFYDDEDDENEAHLYSPPSPSECHKFRLPGTRPIPQALFGRNPSRPNVECTNASNLSLSSMSIQGISPHRRTLPESRSMYRPATSAAGSRRLQSPNSSTRSSTAISFQSSSTSSDDYSYSISLPSGNSHRNSVTSRGRHMSSSMSDDGRAASRQSILTTTSTNSILDTKQIHLYLKKNDSQLSLTSIQTMNQMTMDEEINKMKGKPPLSITSSNGSSVSPNTRKSTREEAKDQDRTSNGGTQSPSMASTFPSNQLLRPGDDAMWRSVTHLPDDDQYQRPRSQYIGELVWQVDSVVYCGGIQAAQNLNMLCRLKIEYIVDLCGEESEIIARYHRPRPECPCLCTRKTAHSRMTMTINVKDDSDPTQKIELTEAQRQDIITYFGDLINLIHKARISGKSVLIHSMKGRNRAPAFAAAYLMHSQRCTRVQALSQISVLMSKTRPGIAVSDNFLRALNHWQNVLGIKSNEGFLSQNSATVFQIKKTAWNG